MAKRKATAEDRAIGNWRWSVAVTLAQAVIYSRPGLREIDGEAFCELGDELAAIMLAAADDHLDQAITIEEQELDVADIIALPTAGSA